MSDSLLEIRNLTKRYGENTVLRDLSFTVRRGEVIVVLGPSGCGKSTLLRCINALEPIQGGEILLGGEVIDRSPAGLPALRRRIGMVFQSYELFPHMTVMENILLAPCKALGTKKEDAKAEAETLLRRVGLWEKQDSYPRELSGGQKQRVAIVRALCMHPEVLLFDEETKKMHIDGANCVGCGRCIGACNFDAIEFENWAATKDLNCRMAEYTKAVVD